MFVTRSYSALVALFCFSVAACGPDDDILGVTPDGGAEDGSVADGSVEDGSVADADVPPMPVPSLLGVLTQGGKDQVGTLVAVPLEGGGVAKVADFEGVPGAVVALNQGFTAHPSDGHLYGMLDEGAGHGKGGIVKFNPMDESFETLHSFERASEGYDPSYAPVFVDSDTFYGSLRNGGPEGHGTLYRYTLSTGVLEVLYAFTATDGTPFAQLFVDSGGNIWGSTSSADAMIYYFDPTAAVSATNPRRLETNAGGSRGFAQRGSSVFGGFSISNSNTDFIPWYYTVGSDNDALSSSLAFDVSDLGSPCARPVMTAGSTANSAVFTLCAGDRNDATVTGTIVQLNGAVSSGNDILRVHSFRDANQLDPVLMRDDGVGNLWGLSDGFPAFVGADVAPSLWSFNTSTLAATTHVSLPESDARSSGGITPVPGAVYGVGVSSGVYNRGSLYRFSTMDGYRKVVDFGYPKGASPRSGLARLKDGKLVGFARDGGDGVAAGSTLLTFDPATRALTAQRVGVWGHSPPIEGADGRLYGYGAARVNASTERVVYALNPSDLTVEVIVDLGGAPSLENYGGLTVVGERFYFVDENELRSTTVTGSDVPILVDFTGKSAVDPVLGVTLVGDDVLWGAALAGGANGHGALFRYDISEDSYSEPIAFAETDGATPATKLLLAKDGWLYGVASTGGSAGFGVLFRVDPAAASPQLEVLHHFDGTIAKSPTGSLMEASDGCFYGVATSAAASAAPGGAIFKYCGADKGLESVGALTDETGYGTAYPSLVEVQLTPVAP